MDVVQAALSAAAERSPWAPLLAAGAGLASSFGPCTAGRFVVVTSLEGRTAAAARSRGAAFVVGLCACYVLIGSIAGAFGRLSAFSGYVYAALAIGLFAFGLRTLVRIESVHRCADGSNGVPHGAAFAGGGAFAMLVSPCCGPVGTALAGMSATGGARFGSMLLAGFAVGHCAPLLALVFGSERIRRLLSSRRLEPAMSVVSGALMVALGCYYAVLA